LGDVSSNSSGHPVFHQASTPTFIGFVTDSVGRRTLKPLRPPGSNIITTIPIFRNSFALELAPAYNY
jgi:hypothetical protein